MAFVVIPSIDLRRGRVVRLKQGDYAQQVNYDVDPIATARSFRDAGAAWMHVVDLDGAKEGRPVQTELIGRVIASSGLKVEVGGGARFRVRGEPRAGAGREGRRRRHARVDGGFGEAGCRRRSADLRLAGRR